MRQHAVLNRAQPSIGTVSVVVPGGLEHGGGIGRQMGYCLQALRDRRSDAPSGATSGIDYRVVDSRGPWFLGSRRIYTVWAGAYLIRAMLTLAWRRFSPTPSLAHVNITGRGSTIRKIILLTAGQGIGLRYLLHVHDYDYAAFYQGRGRLLQTLIRRIFRGAQAVIVLGARDQKLLASALGLPIERITVLPNAVPDPGPNRAVARPAGDPCRLLFLGYLSERKGVPELLQALATPALQARAWHATLAGGGPVDEFRAMAAALGIAGRVDFAGWVAADRAEALRAQSDVLVLPSHAEGLAMAVLEGLAHGLTVVTTPVGAHPEVIEPGVSGLFVPPGDAAALAETLARVIDDGALRAQLSAGARQRFLQKFDVVGYADRVSQLHTDLLSRWCGATHPIQSHASLGR